MWEAHELPETDLYSVYGAEAVDARTNALLERLFLRQVEGIARQVEAIAQLERRLVSSRDAAAK